MASVYKQERCLSIGINWDRRKVEPRHLSSFRYIRGDICCPERRFME